MFGENDYQCAVYKLQTFHKNPLNAAPPNVCKFKELVLLIHHLMLIIELQKNRAQKNNVL